MNKISLKIISLGSKGYFNWMPDSMYLKIIYRIRTGKKLNLRNPITFNEKLQWLKIHAKDTIKSIYVDKYDVREYIANQIGAEYLIPVVGGPWFNADDIDFDKLPDRFVLKCTHDSGGVIICKDKSKMDNAEVRSTLKERLRKNFYYRCREWPYKNIKPRIYAETYMEDSSNELRDYKFFCFNGKVKCMKVDFNRFVRHQANYYDTEMNLLPFGEAAFPPDPSKIIEKPFGFEKMILLAEQLAQGFPFIRVDFYNVNGKIYFGELTFFPASGLGNFIPDEADTILGSWLEIPK